jgi:hypothetical protein
MISIGPEFPIRVVASGGIFVHHDREVPDTIHLMADFPAGHTIFVAGSTANELGLPDLIRGHKGNMFIGRDSLRITPEREFAEEVEEMNEKVGGTGEDVGLHERNWQKCIRTGEKPNCHADLAFQVMTTIALGEMSYQQNKAMRFDPEKMRIIK